MSDALVRTMERHLETLADTYPDRHIGRPGNKAATDYVEAVLRRHRWHVESESFEALDCEIEGARLTIGETGFPVVAGPYTVPVDTTAPLLPIDSVAALEAADLGGAIALLHGDIAADQLFPKSFDFIDTSDHRRIYALLEAGGPAAVIGATGRGGGMGGGLYPYPLIEDGDFDIANAYTTDTTGADLLAHAGEPVRLTLDARRVVVAGRQLTASRGPVGAPRAMVIAHIDSKGGSPGAIDNATGVAALLGIAELLEEYDGPFQVELVPMNGEDYYASSGEHLFVAANEGRWDTLAGIVNMDAIGARDAGTALSMYAVDDPASDLIHRVVRRYPRVTIGEKWYESDHSIVAGHGRPTVALTSTSFRELCATVTHTERDTLDLVDPSAVAMTAEFVTDLIRSLPAVGGPEA